MGRCWAPRGECGRLHPHIELPADVFPEDQPWEEVVVLPPGALEGPREAAWRALLARHARRKPPPAAAEQQQRQQQQQPAGALGATQPRRPASREEGGATAAAQPQRAGTPSAQPGRQSPETQQPGQGWDGSWVCGCGRLTKQAYCRACGTQGPCRRALLCSCCSALSAMFCFLRMLFRWRSGCFARCACFSLPWEGRAAQPAFIVRAEQPSAPCMLCVHPRASAPIPPRVQPIPF